MKNVEKYTIKPAKAEHLSQISAMSKSFAEENIPHDEIPATGFLVSAFKEFDYRMFLRSYDHFYVALNKENVLGFLLAKSSNRIQADESINQLILSHVAGPFVLIKQICTDREFMGHGIASSLYVHLFKKVPRLPVCAAIALNPPNVRSIEFHEKHDFKKAFEHTPPDGILRGVWIRE